MSSISTSITASGQASAHSTGAARGTVAGWGLLVAAGVLVGLAIALDSQTGRILNGIGGVAWLIGAGFLIGSVRRARVERGTVAVLAATVVLLSTMLSPSDLAAASIGFLVGGVLLRVVVRPRAAWLAVVGLIPALWLPTHLSVAIGKAIYRAMADQPANLRTDPPPTAALVPLAMVLMALAGGLIGAALTRRIQSPRVPRA